MSLREFCDTLPEHKQIQLAVNLTTIALPVWNDYAENNPLSYRDTVVGLTHTVPKQLLADTIKAIEIYLSVPKLLRRLKRKNKLLKLYSYFSDPVVALQDTDWELPYPVERAFYSVYNLLASIVDEKKTVFGEPTIYVSINQAIDSIQTSGILSDTRIKDLLKQAENNN